MQCVDREYTAKTAAPAYLRVDDEVELAVITHVLGRLEVLGAGLVELGLVLLENGVQDHLVPAFIKAQQRSSSVRRCKTT